MKPFVRDGASPVFGLWKVPDLGYLSCVVPDKLDNGDITGKEGETFTVKDLIGVFDVDDCERFRAMMAAAPVNDRWLADITALIDPGTDPVTRLHRRLEEVCRHG